MDEIVNVDQRGPLSSIIIRFFARFYIVVGLVRCNVNLHFFHTFRFTFSLGFLLVSRASFSFLCVTCRQYGYFSCVVELSASVEPTAQ